MMVFINFVISSTYILHILNDFYKHFNHEFLIKKKYKIFTTLRQNKGIARKKFSENNSI